MTPPRLTVRQWPRARWREVLRALARPAWVSVRAIGPSAATSLATVLSWEPALSLRYDAARDSIEVATPGDVHRIERPLALFTLGAGGETLRVVVLRFDGGLDLIDLTPASGDATASSAAATAPEASSSLHAPPDP